MEGGEGEGRWREVGRTRSNDEAELAGIGGVVGSHERKPDRRHPDAKDGKGCHEERNEHDEHRARGGRPKRITTTTEWGEMKVRRKRQTELPSRR